jgi:hypothetical protein
MSRPLTAGPAVAPRRPAEAAETTTRLEVTVLTVAVLVVFFALLTVADLLPGLSGAPGLVAPVR